MVFKHFRFVCTLRVVLLTATTGVFFYLLFRTSQYAFLVIIGVFLVYQVYSLIRYVEKTNRDLTRFLQAVKYEDFSQTFAGTGLGSSFNELKTAFNEILTKFQRARAEKEEQYRYLQTVVQHIGIGLLSFQPDGDVELVNTAAKRLLRVPHLRNIQSLESLSKDLVHALLTLKPGEKSLVKVQDKGELLQYIIYATEFILRDHKFTLVSIQNIQSELEEKEIDAWQSLIRVLTHEIMNSVTPIASLASTASGLLAQRPETQERHDEIDGEKIEDIRGAVHTIQKRSEGLLHFVESYRKLTRIPKPDFQIFPVATLFDRVQQLMTTQTRGKAIGFTSSIEPETLELTADPQLIEQVLINLLMNAIQAVEGQPEASIELAALMDDRGRVILRVIDNGPGILEDVQDKIFIPFFTTKKEGSGIGLSLSQQIMRLHRGAISVQSQPNEQTIFTLRF